MLIRVPSPDALSATIGISITYTAISLASSFPDELRLLLGPPAVALPSAMACYVYRAVLLGVIDDDGLVLGAAGRGTAQTARTTLRFARASEPGLIVGSSNLELAYKLGPEMSTSVGGQAPDDFEYEQERNGTKAGSSDTASQV